MRHRGHSRAFFNFDGVNCYLDCAGYCDYSKSGCSDMAKAFMYAFRKPEPNDWWSVGDYSVKDEKLAKKIAKDYHGNYEHEPYSEDNEWFYFTFLDFINMIRFVYDLKNGTIERLYGKQGEYQICIGV